MENHPQHREHHPAGRDAAIFGSGFLKAIAAILVARGMAHRHEQEAVSSLEVAEFQDQASILREPKLGDKLPYINRLAAAILTLKIPTLDRIGRTVGLSPTRASELLGYLKDYNLVEKINGRPTHDPVPTHFLPREPLRWAADQPDSYPELAIELDELGDSIETEPNGNL